MNDISQWGFLKGRVFILGFVGVIVTVVGIVMTCYGFPKIMKYQIKEHVALTEGTDGYQMWKKMPFPLSFNVYIFNVTNVDEYHSGSKPKLQEVGPYVYDERRFKENIHMEENDTVSYNLRRVFTFNEEKSNGLKESDMVNILNVALMGIVATADAMMSSMLGTLNGVIPLLFDDPKTILMTHSVGDILFKGVLINCTGGNMMVEMLCEGMKTRLPHTIRESEIPGEGFYFSMFHNLNNTLDGPYSVIRGEEYPDQLGQIVSYKNHSNLDDFDDACSELKGTDSTLFAPLDDVNYPKIIHIFQPDVCRPMFAEFKAKKMAFGLPAYRYETTKMVLASGKTNPDNQCFCPDNWSRIRDGCALEGVQSLLSCQKASVIASFPHFYLGDPILSEYIAEGMSPNKEKHGTFVDIEPKTGAALRGAKRIQFNMEVLNLTKITILASVMPGLLPIMWVSEGAEINDKVHDLLNGVYLKIKIGKVLQWIVIAIGIILMLAAFHFKRQGSSEKWSWSPNRVDMVMQPYGQTVSSPDANRPAAAQKDSRFGISNQAFTNNEYATHK